MGDETMTRILRTYARRYRFAHPTSEDFIAVVNEVTGKDWRWYFDETWFSSNLCDYAISVRNERAPKLTGFRDAAFGPAGAGEARRKDRGRTGGRGTVGRRGHGRAPG